MSLNKKYLYKLYLQISRFGTVGTRRDAFLWRRRGKNAELYILFGFLLNIKRKKLTITNKRSLYYASILCLA